MQVSARKIFDFAMPVIFAGSQLDAISILYSVLCLCGMAIFGSDTRKISYNNGHNSRLAPKNE